VKRFVIVGAGVLVVLLAVAAPIGAQDTATLPVDEFWARMDQTWALIEQALIQSGANRTATVAQIQVLWEDVRQVRLDDAHTIPVDTSWLRLDAGASDGELRALQTRITALLRFQTEHYGGWSSDSSLDALENVLQDDRFQYEDEQPDPAEEANNSNDSSRDSSNRSSDFFSPGLAQIILMVIGVIAVALFAASLFQTLRVQPAAVTTNDSENSVPATSSAAHDRAETAMSSGDYRAAIRYLYLASLLLLDERGVIRFSPSLTNIEHVRQITGQPQTRGLLEHIVSIFDRVWYGFAPVDADLYRQFQHLIDQLQQVTQTS
jgi:hypothetical protein